MEAGKILKSKRKVAWYERKATPVAKKPFIVLVKSRVWVVIEKDLGERFTASDVAQAYNKRYGMPISSKELQWYLAKYVDLGQLLVDYKKK